MSYHSVAYVFSTFNSKSGQGLQHPRRENFCVMQHPICRGIPVLHQSKMRLADDELEHLVSENSLRIQDMKIWAANEAKLEYPTPCPKSDVPERVKAILVKVEAKLDADWFLLLIIQKKSFSSNM